MPSIGYGAARWEGPRPRRLHRRSNISEPPHAPSTMLRMVPLPRAARGGGQNKLVLAAHFCVRAMPTTTTPFQKRFAPSNKREAKRRKAQSNHWPRSTDKRCRRSMPGRGCAPNGARPPSGASPRHSPGRTHPALAQPQNRVSRHLELAGVLPAYILASVKRAPRRPVLVPVDRCPRAARYQGYPRLE